jgi:uncharacterized protein
MATITMRIDDRTRDQVEAMARARGISVSELLRSAIDDLLGREVDVPRADVPTSLTMVERRLLAMQHEILSRLDRDDKYEVARRNRRIEALEGGFTAEYSDEFGALEPEMSRRDCALVWEILDMFLMLKGSVERLGVDKVAALDKHAPQALTFRGFDIQDSYESRLLGYAQFLISTGRWKDLAEHFDAKHEHGNSHSPRLATYLRMLAAFKPIRESKLRRGFDTDTLLLTEDELATVVAAWPYPSAGVAS